MECTKGGSELKTSLPTSRLFVQPTLRLRLFQRRDLWVRFNKNKTLRAFCCWALSVTFPSLSTHRKVSSDYTAAAADMSKLLASKKRKFKPKFKIPEKERKEESFTKQRSWNSEWSDYVVFKIIHVSIVKQHSDTVLVGYCCGWEVTSATHSNCDWMMRLFTVRKFRKFALSLKNKCCFIAALSVGRCSCLIKNFLKKGANYWREKKRIWPLRETKTISIS